MTARKDHKHDKDGSSLGRRQFLKQAAVALGALTLPSIIPASARGADGHIAPSNRLNLGFVGMGKMMNGHLGALLDRTEIQVMTLCDVEQERLGIQQRRVEEAYSTRFGQPNWKGCVVTGDFRDVAARNDLDAVVIATPEHWHTLVALAMIKSGKDVYCEKPLTLSINEGKVLVEAVRRYGRVFQTGSQQRSEAGFRRACELVRNGRIGKLQTVLVSIGGPPIDCQLPAEPVPAGLDWEMWVGPSPWRPYNSDIAPHLKPDQGKGWGDLDRRLGNWANFRAYREFAGGSMTDWGAHHFDITQWGLGMDGSGPVLVEPPNDGDIKNLTYTYANGVKVLRDPSQPKGVTFIGTEGRVIVDRGFLAAEPARLLDEPIGPGEIHLIESKGHHQDWLDAIQTRRRPIADVEIGHRSVTVCHLGNIAYRLNRPLHWDPAREEFVNDPEANRLMQRPMRSPWNLA